MIKSLLFGTHKETGAPVVLRYCSTTAKPYMVETLRNGVYYQIGKQYARKGDAEKLFNKTIKH